MNFWANAECVTNGWFGQFLPAWFTLLPKNCNRWRDYDLLYFVLVYSVFRVWLIQMDGNGEDAQTMWSTGSGFPGHLWMHRTVSGYLRLENKEIYTPWSIFTTTKREGRYRKQWLPLTIHRNLSYICPLVLSPWAPCRDIRNFRLFRNISKCWSSQSMGTSHFCSGIEFLCTYQNSICD